MGVHTWRLHFTAEAPSGVSRRPRFSIGDHYQGDWPLTGGILAVEGQALPGALAPASALPQALEEVSALVARFGATRPRVARLDIAANIDFGGDLGAAQAFTKGLAAQTIQRAEVSQRAQQATPPHSIRWEGARSESKLGGAYDVGLKYDRVASGLIRLEAQWRFRPRQRPTWEAVFDPLWLHEQFRRRFQPLREASNGLIVAGRSVIVRELAVRLVAKEITASRAEQVIGSLLLIPASGGKGYSPRTLQRRLKLIRTAGFALAQLDDDEVSVDIAAILDLALAPSLWEIAA